MIQKLVDKGFPEHIVADGIIYTWLYMSGSKFDRDAKLKAFNQRFKLSGLSEYGKELIEIVRFDKDESLIWASKALKEFLPSDMQDQYLNEYVKFCCVKNTLWVSEFHILDFISDLFDKGRASLEQKLQQYGDHQISDLSSEIQNRIEKDIETGLSKDRVISSLKRARRVLKLGEQEFLSLHKKPPVIEPEKKKGSIKTSSSSSSKKSNNERKENWWQNLTKKHAIWAAVVIVGITLSWYFISNQISQFERDLQESSHQLIVDFDNERLSIQSRLQSDDIDTYREFLDRFDRDKAYVDSYKVFLAKRYHYRYPSKKYLTCLESDIKLNQESNQNERTLNELQEEKRSRYGSEFDTLLNTLKEKGYELTQKTFTDCNEFFGERKYYVVNEGYWNDIEKVLMTSSRERAEAFTKSTAAESEFESDLQYARSQLRSSYRNIFISRVDRQKSIILNEVETKIETDTDHIGTWVTTVTHLEYDKDAFEHLLNSATVSQWETNSLSTGSTPYANCYGALNSCSGYGCSEVEVSAGGSDAVVTIKNRSDRVVRHGYINSGNKFTFSLPNGTYQIHFYTGKGWNPNKVQNGSSCSNLRGGFVSNESFSKDREWNELNNLILTYQLREMMSGNFRPSGSDASEAF